MKPADFPIGSLESRAAARALLNQAAKTKEVHRVIVTHIGYDGSVALPLPSRVESGEVVIEIVHIGNEDSLV